MSPDSHFRLDLSMNSVSLPIRDFARRLVALEAARNKPPVGDGSETIRVCEKLRQSLTRLAGTAGFRSLISRALAMAKVEVASLEPLKVKPDGSLEGFEWIGWTDDFDSGLVVVAHLIGLLVTFIGEPLTLRLVRDAWSDASISGIDLGSGERP